MWRRWVADRFLVIGRELDLDGSLDSEALAPQSFATRLFKFP
jgi:hypothetical protein